MRACFLLAKVERLVMIVEKNIECLLIHDDFILLIRHSNKNDI